MRWAGIPAAAIGARTLLILPEHSSHRARCLLPRHGARPPLACLPKPEVRLLASRRRRCGHRFLTGIVVSTGPLSVPAFAAYGLVKGAFIATEAAGSLALYISKALTFRQFGALPVESWSRA